MISTRRQRSFAFANPSGVWLNAQQLTSLVLPAKQNPPAGDSSRKDQLYSIGISAMEKCVTKIQI